MIKSFMINIDFTGYEEYIRINKNTGYKSIFGGLITLIVYILSLTIVIYLGLEIFLKDEPLVINSVKEAKSDYYINFNHSGLEIFLSLEYPNFTYYMDKRIYKVSAYLTEINYIGEINEQVVKIKK